MAHKRKIRKARVKITKDFVKDVKIALKTGKKILNQKVPGKSKKSNKFKVPNVKLVRDYGKVFPL